jgi:hypothetical protein
MSDTLRTAQCTWQDESIEPWGPPCGAPATHWSCVCIGASPNVCETHKCRCKRAGLSVKAVNAVGKGLPEIDVDGYVDEKGIEYRGKATRMPDGKYRGLAIVNGCLCRVEFTLRISEV